jgi:catechol 2,3-dioxygenase
MGVQEQEHLVVEAAGSLVLGASDHGVSHGLFFTFFTDPDGIEMELCLDAADGNWRSDPSLVAAPVRSLRR